MQRMMPYRHFFGPRFESRAPQPQSLRMTTITVPLPLRGAVKRGRNCPTRRRRRIHRLRYAGHAHDAGAARTGAQHGRRRGADGPGERVGTCGARECGGVRRRSGRTGGKPSRRWPIPWPWFLPPAPGEKWRASPASTAFRAAVRLATRDLTGLTEDLLYMENTTMDNVMQHARPARRRRTGARHPRAANPREHAGSGLR